MTGGAGARPYPGTGKAGRPRGRETPGLPYRRGAAGVTGIGGLSAVPPLPGACAPVCPP
ncbi:predicted protein [Streptomyces sp. SPB78]|nr:predicted protein [Streptomyces sp. SPB78]